MIYFYFCCYYYLLLLLFFLFPLSPWLCVTDAWVEAGFDGQGLVAGLRVGQAFGVLLLPGCGVGSSSPRVPGHSTSICDSGVKSH